MRRTLVLLCLFGLCPFAAADEPPAAGKPPSSGKNEKIPTDPPAAPSAHPVDPLAAGLKIVPLSLADAARLGAAANLEIQRGSYDAPIAQQDKITAEASFDTLLTAGFEAARTENPVANMFQGETIIADETIGTYGGLSRQLRSGGTVSLLYRADRLSTNNPFANLGWTHGASVEVAQPILRGAGDVAIADIRRAQNALSAARAGYVTDIEVVLLRIIENYFNLVFADDNLSAFRKSEEVAREQLENANSRLAAEVGTPLDVAEARAGVERRVSEVLEAENLRGTVQDQLIALIMPFTGDGRPDVYISPTDRTPKDPNLFPSKRDEQRYVDLALQGRPEIRAAKADIATRGIDTLVAKNAICPQLDILGRAALGGLNPSFGGAVSNTLTGEAVSGAIGLEFSLFIGRRAARSQWLRAAWLRRQSLLNLRELENQIVVQVRAALRDMDTARGRLAAATSEVKAATAQLNGEILRQQQGKSTPFLVLQREQDLTGGRQRLGRASADLRIAMGRLWRSVGSVASSLGIDARRWAPCATGQCR